MFEVPLASDAIATARMVCDFEPGIDIEPLRIDFSVKSFICHSYESPIIVYIVVFLAEHLLA